jgi:tetratricopeptide (TPR) repeat protein
MAEHYTRSEASRIVGVDVSRLRYWERLRLVHPRARWGERFYSFSDLVALDTVKRLTERRIPALRLRRAVSALEQEMGESRFPLERLQMVEHGGDVFVVHPGSVDPPFSPLSRQWLLPFEARELSRRLHKMESRTAEEWFQIALECESQPQMISEAIEAYRQVIRLAPDWIEAHLNIGVAHYQLGEWEEAHKAFRAAVAIDPANPLAHYNLGCVLEEIDELDEAIEQLRCAIQAMPAHADAHFNLAVAYERRGEQRRARAHWKLYLRYEPNGPWADTARARLAPPRRGHKRSAPIPFRVKNS